MENAEMDFAVRDQKMEPNARDVKTNCVKIVTMIKRNAMNAL